MKKKLIVAISILFCVSAIGAIIVANIPHVEAKELVKAIKAENCNEVKALLAEGVNPNVTTTSDFSEFILNIVEDSGERPITVACDTGNLEIVEMLIAHGATAEPSKKGGWSPLRETLFYYQPEDKKIVELLLENGALVNEDSVYEPVVFVAAEMIPKKYDKEKSSGSYYVGDYDAEIAQGITEIVSLLLDKGNYDVNIKKSNGNTLLICAAKSGNKYLVEYLVSAGCNVSAADNFDKTAIDYANEEGFEDIADFLSKAMQ